ncbi:hypothetical protein [Streptomyces sp. NPDC055036]
MKNFTVTVAGQEQADGAEPFVYVLSAASMAAAEHSALDWHIRDQDDATARVTASREGVPPEGADTEWNDLRQILKTNLHKHECRGHNCRRAANVLAHDGFCGYFLCVPCTRRGITRQHIERHRAKLIPIARAACVDGCEG